MFYYFICIASILDSQNRMPIKFKIFFDIFSDRYIIFYQKKRENHP